MSATAVAPSIETPAVATAPPNAPRTRTEINRVNAQHSTGPRTPEGKARASMNALKHGLFAAEVVLPDEDREQFEALARQYVNDFHAETSQELALVQDIVDSRWRIRRVFARETALFVLTSEQQRANVENLFEADTQTITALAQAAGFQANARLFNQLALAEMRLYRRAELAEQMLRASVKVRQAEAETTRPSPAPAPSETSGFVPNISPDPAFPSNMPHFSGPLKKENRRQWLRKHGHHELAPA